MAVERRVGQVPRVFAPRFVPRFETRFVLVLRRLANLFICYPSASVNHFVKCVANKSSYWGIPSASATNRFLVWLSGAVVPYHFFCLIDGIACGSTK